VTISVLIADDQSMVRAGFAAVLAAQPGIAIVGQAADGTEAVALARELRPDVVVMDVRMPHLNGIEATRALQTPPRSSDYVPRVLMLTTFDIDEYVYEALRAGASGFLLKDATPEELVAAVRIVADGEALLAPSVTRRLIEDFARSAPPPKPATNRLADLTEREREVMTRVAAGKLNKVIADELNVSVRTVEVHRARVFAKLGVRSAAEVATLLAGR